MRGIKPKNNLEEISRTSMVLLPYRRFSLRISLVRAKNYPDGTYLLQPQSDLMHGCGSLASESSKTPCSPAL